MIEGIRSKGKARQGRSAKESAAQLAEEAEQNMSPSVAEQIRSARIEQDLSIDWVADQMRLPDEYIENLETGAYTNFRDLAIVRGYIRIYAQLLRLNADDLVKQFQSEVDIGGDLQETPQIASDKNANVDAFIHRHVGLMILAGAILLTVVVGATIWILLFTDLVVSVPTEPVEESATTTTDGPTPVGVPPIVQSPIDRNPTAIPLERRSVDDASSEDEIDSEPDYDAENPNLLGQESILEDMDGFTDVPMTTNREREDSSQLDSSTDALLRTDASSAADTPLSSAAPAPLSEPEEINTTLEFEFTQASWMRVIDQSGEVLFMDTKGAGEDLVLDGSPPYQVQIGYVRGVTMKYGGEERDIPPGSGNTAEFTVGE